MIRSLPVRRLRHRARSAQLALSGEPSRPPIDWSRLVEPALVTVVLSYWAWWPR